MSPNPDGPERTDEEPDQVPGERDWKPPERSDQAPGEEVVQVNDPYAGDAPPAEADGEEDDQHPTGG